MDLKLNIESTNKNEIAPNNENVEQTPNKIPLQNEKLETTPNNKFNTDINIISPIPENFNAADNDSNYNNNLLENIDFNENINIDFNSNSPNIVQKNLFINYKQKKHHPQKKRISKSNNKQKNDDSKKKAFHTKYDYILQPGMKSSGPVEIPPDFEIKDENFAKIEKDFAKFTKMRGKSADRIENSKKKIRKTNVKIFNNRKNNDICSNLLKQSIENGKELSLFPYAKEKQKINKTIDTIGFSNGITYFNTSIFSGGNVNFGDHNIHNIMRENNKKDKKYRNSKTIKEGYNKKNSPSLAEINL